MRYNVIQKSIGNKAEIDDSRYCGLIKYIKVLLCIFFFVFVSTTRTIAQTKDLTVETKQAMMNATKFMVEKISVNGGYVSLYLPDLSLMLQPVRLLQVQVLRDRILLPTLLLRLADVLK